jgi:hypothetical protein
VRDADLKARSPADRAVTIGQYCRYPAGRSSTFRPRSGAGYGAEAAPARVKFRSTARRRLRPKFCPTAERFSGTLIDPNEQDDAAVVTLGCRSSAMTRPTPPIPSRPILRLAADKLVMNQKLEPIR